MNAAFRICVAALTLVVFAVAALASGHARGQAPVAGQVTICVGLTIQTITVDADGQPTTAHRTCPDAITKLAAVPAAETVSAAPVALRFRRAMPAAVRMPPSDVRPAARARAPPRAV